MGNVAFRRCKHILSHDQYMQLCTCSAHLYRPVSPWLEKKSRDFCGRDGLFLTPHCFLVENRTSADVMTFF